MLREIVFTQNELVEMLQGKTVGMITKPNVGYLFSMEEKPAQDYTPLTRKETEDLMDGKVTVNQLREAHGLSRTIFSMEKEESKTIDEDAAILSMGFQMMREGLLSVDEFKKIHPEFLNGEPRYLHLTKKDTQDFLVYKNILRYVGIQKDYINRIRKVDKKFREETQNNEKL